MNFIKQIENALKAINDARFQDLINHLLHAKGNDFIGAPGSVVGKEKTSKGAPDSFFMSDEKYVFVEYTTIEKIGKSKKLIDKLIGDVVHCFNEAKTGVPKEEIAKIILACNEKVSPDDIKQLLAKKSEFNPLTGLEILDIQNLPMEIYDFPGLSNEYLGIQIIKGEIYNLPDFLVKTTKGLQPSLTNPFIGRVDEISNAKAGLEAVDIIMLSGHQGVGKSKLAVEVLKKISKTGFIPIVIQSSSVPLWDDFVNLFQNGKDYVILFDDANKSLPNLTYLLDFIQKPRPNRIKLIITTRDYVKQRVEDKLDNSKYKEIIIGDFKDAEITQIITAALPDLKFHSDIKNKIVDISKGNARVALMATYSVTPDSETNYLDSPLKLYEKYFRKVAEDIEAFSSPIMLQAIAIVSFFGVFNRKNEQLKGILSNEFAIDWNDLWTAILHLHNHEILDVHSNEVVKVSDQVLATYSFYKCFLDQESKQLDYGKWIIVFQANYSSRITNSLIDINNTFNYHHVKELVLPYLKSSIPDSSDAETLYSYYSLFWFYLDFQTLNYLKDWISSLPLDTNTTYKFSYEHNDHVRPTKYIEILTNFWNHQTEFLKPSLELGIDLVMRQPKRLPEFLKFLNTQFTYKIDDLHYGYHRQNILLEVLVGENRSGRHIQVAKGIFLFISNMLLGWEFTDWGASKGRSFSYTNFHLYDSAELRELRKKLLLGIALNFDVEPELGEKVLTKILYPGKIDPAIPIAEYELYAELVNNNLSSDQFHHCEFVNKLVKRFKQNQHEVPVEWDRFIKSELMEISRIMKPEWERKDNKSFEEKDKEKREQIESFINSMDWEGIERFLLKVDRYNQQQSKNEWHIQQSVTDVYITIAKMGEEPLKSALALYFSGKLQLPLTPTILYYSLNNGVLTGKKLWELMDNFEFRNKAFWQLSFFSALPEKQANIFFTKKLFRFFKKASENIFIFRMEDYVKFGNAFEKIKLSSTVKEYTTHNIITYLTHILLKKGREVSVDLGYHFCSKNHLHFPGHINLFKQAYSYLKQQDTQFDYDGKELEAVLNFDNYFFVEYLQQKSVNDDYLSFKLEDFKLEKLWELEDYNTIIHDSLEIMFQKTIYTSNLEHSATKLFYFEGEQNANSAKGYEFLRGYMQMNHKDERKISMIISIVLHRYPQQFVSFLREFLMLNKDTEFFKGIHLTKGGITTGSRV
ncbi:ATP-binding protein, partial [Pedobacter sp. JCM 36344]|uniref:ATP-binding protein n=1 Tax=Pedobacter sp. JCM 36344 TaxID=3374280 RepID=UPI003979A31F